MSRSINQLTTRTVQTLETRGRHADGGGLYLLIAKDGSRRWVFVWRRAGRWRELGLGAAKAVPLARARQLATEARLAVAEGRDPIQERRMRARTSAIPTFGEIADEQVAKVTQEARNAKHAAQWQMTLKVYAAPLRSKRVDEIETGDVLEVIKPIWTEKPETASRLRGRIERVLDAAKARGLRSGENPARWRGHLDHLLPKPAKSSRSHHAALPYCEVPSFMRTLRERDGVAARALEFAILTAARTGEVLGARWEEIDRSAGIWTIPADRMKGGREHRVPLAERCLEILAELARLRDGDFVFPGQRRGKPLSNMALEMVLRRMGVENATVHGFRSSFRDWAGDKTKFPREVIEAALAHIIGDKAEQAYRRGDALEKRRALMDAWATLTTGATGMVVQFA